MSGTVRADLLEILVCPRCKGELELRTAGDQHEALDCPACALRFPIEEGIPTMLVDEAQPLDRAEEASLG